MKEIIEVKPEIIEEMKRRLADKTKMSEAEKQASDDQDFIER